MAKFKTTIPRMFYSLPWTVPIPKIDKFVKLYPKEETVSSVIRKQFFEAISQYDSYELIFRDGSKPEKGVGATVVSTNCNKLMKLPDRSCIHTEEITGIKGPPNYASGLEDREIMIMSDSMRALPVDEILKQVKEQINFLRDLDKNMKFLLVPSHCGIKWNEEADKAAAEAMMTLP
nr:unnamed protein product [Callosobruchus chinensis]